MNKCGNVDKVVHIVKCLHNMVFYVEKLWILDVEIKICANWTKWLGEKCKNDEINQMACNETLVMI